MQIYTLVEEFGRALEILCQARLSLVLLLVLQVARVLIHGSTVNACSTAPFTDYGLVHILALCLVALPLRFVHLMRVLIQDVQVKVEAVSKGVSTVHANLERLSSVALDLCCWLLPSGAGR